MKIMFLFVLCFAVMILFVGCYKTINGTNVVFYKTDSNSYLRAKIAKNYTKGLNDYTIELVKTVLKAEALKFYHNDDYEFSQFSKSLNSVNVKDVKQQTDLTVFLSHVAITVHNLDNIERFQYLNDLSEIL